MKISKGPDGVTIDASDLGPLFGIDPSEVPQKMKSGEITSRFETGADEDEGRFRLTFWYRQTRLRLTCDAEGEVIKQSRSDSGRGVPLADR